MHLALVLCLLSWPASNDLGEARKKLETAIKQYNAEAAADAVQELKRLNSTEAVKALAKAYELARIAEEPLKREVKEILKKKKGKDSKPAMDAVCAKQSALQAIRLAIGLSFRSMRKPEVIKDFIKRLKGSGDGELRAHFAMAVAGSGSMDALFAMLDRLKREKDPRVVVAVLDAMAMKRIKDKEIIAQICGKLEDEAWPVAAAAAEALGRIKSVEAVEPLIKALKSAEGRLRDDFNRALGAITGVDKHGSYDAWQDWWGRSKEKVLAGKYIPEPAESAGKGDSGTTFYGLPVVSKRPVFVIDASNSMKAQSSWTPSPDEPRPKGLELAGDIKIQVAQFELKKVVLMLPDDAIFNIVFFHRDVDVFHPTMVQLTPETRKRAIEWIDNLKLAGQTNIYEGMKRGFSFGSPDEGAAKGGSTIVSGPDTIYLLSDGKPTTGIKETDEFCRAIAELNRFRKITIHTVAIQPSAASGEFLSRLAKENNGQYAARGGEKKGKGKGKKKKDPQKPQDPKEPKP